MWDVIRDNEQRRVLIIDDMHNTLASAPIELEGPLRYLVDSANGGLTQFQVLNTKNSELVKQIYEVVDQKWELQKRLDAIAEAVKGL